MSELGDCGELGGVESSSLSVNSVPGCGSRFVIFHGFSLPAESGEVLINRRRVPILRRAASVILANAFGNSIVSDSCDSRGAPPHAVASAASPSLM